MNITDKNFIYLHFINVLYISLDDLIIIIINNSHKVTINNLVYFLNFVIKVRVFCNILTLHRDLV